MKFKPLTQKYDFSSEVLTKDFPDFMAKPVKDWLLALFRVNYLARLVYGNTYYLDSDFHSELQITFRRSFSEEWDAFIFEIFQDSELTANLLALCLQNYVQESQSQSLEKILSSSGSGYMVVKVDTSKDKYEKGNFDLHERVDDIVIQQSTAALENNDLLTAAWQYCYSRNPDYEKTVSKCSDFLEGYLGKKYFPKDPKPQLKKFVHAFQKSPQMLSFKGDTIVDPKNMITDLLVKVSDIRGQHTQGAGRVPTKEEAEFVLHTTIYVWNLHQ